ncbi:hypothetical protein G647_00311 [Cladophialophora carrionii CBS 160.54]|uniref:Uncharacterized protein n=1 Tax=Cladophialophora carrionii CBS 160.54 TaxID=1279043 RepID=V9DPJ9_9EURO|nr:uncharacterized protein G647_00311 [Cladophialophora carrionii CBS 160.54]ETI27862.1 hypothetical protein G647_00311 [Cladophialophora carrionii CBS 160.54]
MKVLYNKQDLIGQDILPDDAFWEVRHILDSELKHHFFNSLEFYETFSPDPGVAEFDPSQGDLFGIGRIRIDMAAGVRLVLDDVVYNPALVTEVLNRPMVVISLSRLLKTLGCTTEIDRYDNWVIKQGDQIFILGAKPPHGPPEQRWALGPRIPESGNIAVPRALQAAIALGSTEAEDQPPRGVQAPVMRPTAQSAENPVVVGMSTVRAPAAPSRPAPTPQHNVSAPTPSLRERAPGFQHIGGMWISQTTPVPGTPVRSVPSSHNRLGGRVEADLPKPSPSKPLPNPQNAARSRWGKVEHRSLPRVDERAARAPTARGSKPSAPVMRKPNASLDVGFWASIFGQSRTSTNRKQDKHRPAAAKAQGTPSTQGNVGQGKTAVTAQKCATRQEAGRNGQTATTAIAPGTAKVELVKQGQSRAGKQPATSKNSKTTSKSVRIL